MITPRRSVQTILAHAPLVHVLAQVRFTPVLEIGKSIPGIQQKLKDIGFLRFEKNQIQNFLLTGPTPKVETIERWDFSNREKRTGVVLTQDFVVLQTSEYTTFQDFRGVFHRVLDVVATDAGVSLAQRIGIRYVDLIRKAPNETFDQYLHPGLLGFPFSELNEETLSEESFRSEAAAKTPDGALSVRCMSAGGGQFLPPDLLPPVLRYDVSLGQDEVVTIIDFDRFAMIDDDFVPDLLLERLDSLHETANKAFRAVVTPFALDKWGAPK